MSSLEEIDIQLTRARADARRLASLKRRMEQARAALREEGERAADLADTLAKEQGDVAALEGHGLRRWLAALSGSRDERLAKEHAELATAKLRHDTAVRTVAGLEQELADMGEEIQALGSPEQRFQALLDDKEERLVEDQAVVAGRLADLAARRADAEADRRELQEAQASGRQRRLLAFDRELADVEHGGLPLGAIDVGSGLRFADYFFDGLIADWMVQSRINRAGESVAAMAAEVKEKLKLLRGLEGHAEEAIRAMRAERAQILAPEESGPAAS
jgi:hypothetical protein